MLAAPFGAKTPLVSPEDVNDAGHFPKHRSAYGRNAAWPHYLARQAVIDVRAMVKRAREAVTVTWGCGRSTGDSCEHGVQPR